MQYYAVLTFTTLVIAGLSLRLWRVTGSVSFPLGMALMYFWTLQGAWVLVRDKLHDGPATVGGEYHYSYFEERLFPISLNSNYMATLLIYSLFLIMIAVVLNAVVEKPDRTRTWKLIPLSHSRILTIALVCGVASYVIVRGDLTTAAALEVSGYNFTRGSEMMQQSRWFTVHQLLNYTALMTAAIGLAVLFSGDEARFLAARRKPWHGTAYVLVILALLGYMVVLGNRADLLVAMSFGVLFYIANRKPPSLIIVGTIFVVGILAANTIEACRGNALRDLPQVLAESKPWDLTRDKGSNEQFAAHMSMYGCLQYHVPLTFGSSFVSLAASVIPRALWSDRPESIYDYYARSVNAEPGQGYTIHHATGWYLNFGLPGVILGAVLLALVWAKCFNNLNTPPPPGRGLLLSAMRVLAPWALVGFLPKLMRTGPEGYKALFFEALLIPSIVVAISATRHASVAENEATAAEPVVAWYPDLRVTNKVKSALRG